MKSLPGLNRVILGSGEDFDFDVDGRIQQVHPVCASGADL